MQFLFQGFSAYQSLEMFKGMLIKQLVVTYAERLISEKASYKLRNSILDGIRFIRERTKKLGFNAFMVEVDFSAAIDSGVILDPMIIDGERVHILVSDNKESKLEV